MLLFPKYIHDKYTVFWVYHMHNVCMYILYTLLCVGRNCQLPRNEPVNKQQLAPSGFPNKGRSRYVNTVFGNEDDM